MVLAEILEAFNDPLDSGSEEDFARYFAERANPLSVKHDIEIGAKIFYDPVAGQYSLSAPVTSFGAEGIDPRLMDSIRAPKGSIESARAHTHARFTGPGSLRFSGALGVTVARMQRYMSGDIGVAWRSAVNTYATTPGGTLLKWSFSDYYYDMLKGHAGQSTLVDRWIYTISTNIPTN